MDTHPDDVVIVRENGAEGVEEFPHVDIKSLDASPRAEPVARPSTSTSRGKRSRTIMLVVGFGFAVCTVGVWLSLRWFGDGSAAEARTKREAARRRDGAHARVADDDSDAEVDDCGMDDGDDDWELPHRGGGLKMDHV
jgi:hypothetical protein